MDRSAGEARRTEGKNVSTVFTKIIKREIPSDIVYEDDQCIVFKDIHPQAPVHVLVVPKKEIPRLVDVFARRLQIQERMTNQIAETIREKINPLGVAVVCEGTHLCMSMRGVEKQNSFAITSAMLGAFRDNARTRMEFLELVRSRAASISALPSNVPLACINE